MTNYFPLLIFSLSLLLISPGLTKPFVGIHDWNGARYGNLARQTEVSTHYPPLLPLLIRTSYQLFGVTEWATRLIPLIATSFSMVLLYFVLRLITSTTPALVTVLLLLSTPLVRYYGKNPVHEPVVLLFICMCILAAMRKHWPLVSLGLLLASLTSWSGPFIALALSLLVFGRQPKKLIVCLWTIPLVVAGLHLIPVASSDIIATLLLRTNLTSSDHFTFWQFVTRLRAWTFALFTPLVMLLVPLGLVRSYRRFRLLAVFFVAGTGYPLLFSNATFIHEYYIFPFILFFGVLVVSALVRLPVIVHLVLIALVFGLGQPYYAALQASHGDDLARSIGLYLNQNFPSHTTIQIQPTTYGLSRFPYLSFYSVQNITTNPADVTLTVDEASQTFNISYD